MNYIKDFRMMSLTTIVATIFIGFFLIYFELLQTIINFLLIYQGQELQVIDHIHK